MIKITRSNEQYRSKKEWLDTTHHFSFAEYFDPNRMNFGPLRVFNDDTIEPGTGFDLHPHRDMEIITYVIDGQLEHKDTQGNHGVVNSGEVQVMSAGSGITHSEYNHSSEKPLRLLQMWIFANRRGLQPSWKQQSFRKEERLNKLLSVVSPIDSSDNTPLRIHQDAKFYISSLSPQREINYQLPNGRKAYLFVIDGRIKLNIDFLENRDAATIEGEKSINIKAEDPSELILIDLPEKFLMNQ